MKKNKEAVPTTIAVIFGVLLLATSYMWLVTEKKLQDTLSYNADDASFQRDKLRAECLALDPESQQNCAKSINLINETIRDVQQGRAEALNPQTVQ